MRVKIGDQIYSSNDEPILLILDEGDRQGIINLDPDAKGYCVYPQEKFTPDQIAEWMSNVRKSVSEDDEGG